MTLSPYQEVPVDAARRVAHDYAKAIVVIVAWDEAHNVTHVTTYGREARYKPGAAKLGEILAQAAGIDMTQKLAIFEDFRHRTEAQWAEEREQLMGRIKTLEARHRNQESKD